MRGQATSRERVAALAKLVIVFRLGALNLTILELVVDPDRAPVVSLTILVLALVLYAQLRAWSREGEIVRHPAVLLGDCALTMALLAYFGPESPFFLSTIGLPLAAGVQYERRLAILLSLALMVVYYAVLLLGDASRDLYFPTYVTLPLLYPAAGAGAAAVRRLLDEQAGTQQQLASAELAAVAGEERTRVAREMHDSLGKTLYGIALQASGLERRVRAEAPTSAALARTLSGAAQRAAGEAREIISDLRSDALELPLDEALRLHVAAWSERAAIPAEVRGDRVDLPHPGTRYELFSIVKEALRNVEAHARASRVAVALEQVDAEVRLRVTDDGVGMGASGTPAELEPEGHWGLIGMAERAERIGATVAFEVPPAGGTCLLVRIPAGDVRTPEPWATRFEPKEVPA